ncbi:hypothetical protein ABLE91_21970 [Aquabacter sp. CN5-332]|uniref:hypothetical protein n=1 Tax=Aquabacter sp. CN5-332 TaxID=3156608 RepID=UPI0032B5A317
MTLLDLTAFALAGVALTGAVLHFASPVPFMAPAGGPGIPAEVALQPDTTTRTAATRFGGDKGETKADPAWASFPRAF